MQVFPEVNRKAEWNVIPLDSCPRLAARQQQTTWFRQRYLQTEFIKCLAIDMTLDVNIFLTRLWYWPWPHGIEYLIQLRFAVCFVKKQNRENAATYTAVEESGKGMDEVSTILQQCTCPFNHKYIDNTAQKDHPQHPYVQKSNLKATYLMKNITSPLLLCLNLFAFPFLDISWDNVLRS